ncbi:MAG: hypothetical protein R2911_42345 [Caldilineaceae bacterium]
MNVYLYKVSPPRSDRLFHPSKFWHTADWESSTTRKRDGYIEDDVLYAGDFDEVSIHLLPRVRTVRVRSGDASASTLQALGIECGPGKTAHLFVHVSFRAEVESFCPTIYRFESDGFQHIRRGEYVSWETQRAISCRNVPLAEALAEWNVEVCYVEDLDELIAKLSSNNIYFDEQR